MKTVSPMPLGAREVYQLLKDVAQGERRLEKSQAVDEQPLASQCLNIDIDGWQLSLAHDAGRLLHCERCLAPDGRAGSLQHWHRSGTDPLAFLSAWEYQQIERRLESLLSRQ